MHLSVRMCCGFSQHRFLATYLKCSSPVKKHFFRCREDWKLLSRIRKYSAVGLAASGSQLKKQPFKKKNIEIRSSETLKVSAFTTAQEFDIYGIENKLKDNPNYRLTAFNSEFGDSDSVIHILPQGSFVNNESKDVFVFREGSVVLWNFTEKETLQLLQFLKNFHKDSFSEKIIQEENEFMPYVRSSEITKTSLMGGKIILANNENETLDKFAVSNAMALSVHLGAYESLLNDYIDSMLPVTEDLKKGRTIRMNKKEVLRKMGELFALRHVINLSSDLLDTPDFYWDREELENLYNHTFNYFCIGSRTKVMNDKINHCIELVELLSTHLSDSHHVRLEWMIIVLIMVEVAFEIFHYAVQYMSGIH